MARAKNYEPASTFVKVIQRKLLASFFPDTVYKKNSRKKLHSLCTIILQPYITESCSFQQNVQKEFGYMTKAST